MTARDFEDLVLAITVECGPLDTLWIVLGPVEVYSLPAVLDSEDASCARNMLASMSR